MPGPVLGQGRTERLLAQAPTGREPARAGPVCVLTPSAGEGPFYFDPDLVRSDITEGLPGAPREVALQVVRAGDCATLDGARVDLWHADAVGLYSGYERQRGTGKPSRDVTGKTFLRGTQFTSPEGRVAFRTIYPSWYAGRTPHVHFKIFLGGREVVASQVFFPEDVNEEVFAGYEPYRERRGRRRTFNSNDRFLQGSVDGVFCAIERGAVSSSPSPPPRRAGYRATAVVAVA
jgi:protocatechuate 3,4-dioxygenase beta subunit